MRFDLRIALLHLAPRCGDVAYNRVPIVVCGGMHDSREKKQQVCIN